MAHPVLIVLIKFKIHFGPHFIDLEDSYRPCTFIFFVYFAVTEKKIMKRAA